MAEITSRCMAATCSRRLSMASCVCRIMLALLSKLIFLGDTERVHGIRELHTLLEGLSFSASASRARSLRSLVSSFICIWHDTSSFARRAPCATLASTCSSWVYKIFRDVTGYLL
jgi:hypothetical protein